MAVALNADVQDCAGAKGGRFKSGSLIEIFLLDGDSRDVWRKSWHKMRVEVSDRT